MMRLFQQILEFVFPRKCLGCKKAGTFLCEECLQKIPTHQIQHCPVCLKKSPMGAVCKTCLGWELDGLFVVAPYSQKSLLQKCIKTMKYRSAYSLAKILGKWMRTHWPLSKAILVPVPLHSSREKMRGYNQAEFLTREIGEAQKLLKRIRNTPPQAELSREDRLTNLKNSFELSHEYNLLNKKFILVDDVCSTGTTLNECAKVLRQAGATQIWGLVLARG